MNQVLKKMDDEFDEEKTSTLRNSYQMVKKREDRDLNFYDIETNKKI